MKQQLRILMVDDHPMIIEGYKNALLDHYQDTYEVVVETAHDCDQALACIKAINASNKYDLALIDIQIPAATKGSITSGEGIAIALKKKQKDTKVVILTMHNTADRMQTILEDVDPDAFLIKSDISATELAYACDQVLDEKVYYSNTVNSLLRKIVTNKVVLDEHSRQILYHLAKGVATKNLIHHIDLSLSAIEKRKTNIKESFGIPSCNDNDLVTEARKRGFV